MEIKNVDVYNLFKSVKRSGYPMETGDPEELNDLMDKYNLPYADEKRGVNLGNVPTGTGHDNFLKGVIVQFDIKYPQYFTPQLQRYNWIDIISSQSKMHRLTKNKLTSENCNKWVFGDFGKVINDLIDEYNDEKTKYPLTFIHEDRYMNVKETIDSKYDHFMSIVSNLPMGYEMWMGISTNYLQLKTIYQQRKKHKLHDDWGYFCEWVESLPMFKELCLEGKLKSV